jgi:hypothetical protein
MTLILMMPGFLLNMGALAGSVSCSGSLPSSQYLALQQLYNDTDGPAWTYFNPFGKQVVKWNFPSDLSAPCEEEWTGVLCETCEGPDNNYTITQLDLGSAGPMIYSMVINTIR